MSKHKPRRPRWPATPHTLFKAHMRAARLTPAEVAQIMAKLRPAADQILAGVGSRAHWAALAGACTMAQAIESQGIVRGLSDHLALAEGSLNAIAQRAEVQEAGPTASHAAAPTWRPTPLRFDERDNIALLLDLVEFQVSQLSAGELADVTARAQARVLQAGGEVVRYTIEGAIT